MGLGLIGKKDIFLETVDYADKNLEKEREADKFACKWTLTNEEVGKILTVARPAL